MNATAPEETGLTAMMLKCKSCLTSGTQHLPQYSKASFSRAPPQMGLAPITTAKTTARNREDVVALQCYRIQNFADANMAHQFYEAIKAVYGPKSHSTHPVRTMMGPTEQRQERHSFSLGGASRGLAKPDQPCGPIHN